MNFLVCPVDGERLEAVRRRPAPDARPVVHCPKCGKYFVFTSERALDELAKPV